MVFKCYSKRALLIALIFKAFQFAVGRVRMEDIEMALRNGETFLKRSDVENGILSLPQLTDHHGDHIRVLGAEYPEFLQPNEEVNMFISQSSQKSKHKVVPGPSNIHEYIPWLERKACFIEQVLLNQRPISAPSEIQSTSRTLSKLADELEFLRPDNESEMSSDINMRRWRDYWNALICEMKTVASHTTCSGAFVLTTWPYSEFLTTLARTLCEKIA